MRITREAREDLPDRETREQGPPGWGCGERLLWASAASRGGSRYQVLRRVSPWVFREQQRGPWGWCSGSCHASLLKEAELIYSTGLLSGLVTARRFSYIYVCIYMAASQVAQIVKNLPAVQKTWVQSLGGEDPPEKGMATHSSILAWRIPWTQKPGGPQLMGLQRVGHAQVTNTHTHTHTHVNGSLLQYSGLGNPMDRGAWRAIVHGVTRESDMT